MSEASLPSGGLPHHARDFLITEVMSDADVTDDPRFPKLLTSTQAARLLGIDRRTLTDYPIPHHRVGALGWRRYDITDLRAWRDRTRVEINR
jgi:hypothetical protein